MRRFFNITVAMVIAIITGHALAALPPASPFDLSWDGKTRILQPGSAFGIPIVVRVPEGHYLYADETEIDFTSLEGLIISDIKYPGTESYVDPYMGKTVQIYRGDVVITIEGRVPEGLTAGGHELVVIFKFRGCSPTICYRPEEREISFNVEVTPPRTADKITAVGHDAGALTAKEGERRPATTLSGLGFGELLAAQDFGKLLDRGWFWTFIIVFVAGVLTSLTPCVWPLVPVILLFIGVHSQKRFWQNLLLAATLTSGIVLVYALLGIVAVALGKNLGFLYQQRSFLAAVVLFFVVMSLSMFGVFNVRMPRRWHERVHRLGGKGLRGAFLAGVGMGLIASPCSGPVLAALLGYAALQKSYVLGFAMLFVFGVGMGLLMIVLGAGYGELAHKLRSGPWMLWVKRGLGVMLLFPAVFYMGSLFGWAGGGVFVTPDVPRVEWLTDETDALRFARGSGRPVMVEFTAKWCPPCRALDNRFFGRDDIVSLSYQLVPLRIDASVETGDVRSLIKKYRAVGWPTVIFLDPNGHPYNDLKVGDYNPELLEKNMRAAIERSGNP